MDLHEPCTSKAQNSSAWSRTRMKAGRDCWLVRCVPPCADGRTARPRRPHRPFLGLLVQLAIPPAIQLPAASASSVRTQRSDEFTWMKQFYTGTGFPRVFYLIYQPLSGLFPASRSDDLCQGDGEVRERRSHSGMRSSASRQGKHSQRCLNSISVLKRFGNPDGSAHLRRREIRNRAYRRHDHWPRHLRAWMEMVRPRRSHSRGCPL